MFVKLGFFNYSLTKEFSFNALATFCLTKNMFCEEINQFQTVVIFTRPDCLHGFYIIHVLHFDRFQTSL